MSSEAKYQPPPGYRWWSCDDCLASCNFEAMYWCLRRDDPTAPCAFDREQPESAGGIFEFICKK